MAENPKVVVVFRHETAVFVSANRPRFASGYHFLAQEYLIKETISRADLPADYLDGLHDVTKGRELNAVLVRLSNEWFLDKDGNDIFEYQGISLGDLFCYQFYFSMLPLLRYLLCLKAAKTKYDVDEIYADDPTPLFSEVASLLELSIRPFDAPPSGVDPVENLLAKKRARIAPSDFYWRHPLSRRILAAAINVIGRIRPRPRRKAVLIAEYGPMNAFVSRIVGGSKRAPMIHTAGFSHIPRVYLRGGRVLLFKNPGAPIDKAVAALIAKWDDLRNDNAIAEKFVFEDLDCWPLFHRHAGEFIRQYLGYYASQIRPAAGFLAKNNIKLLFLPFDSPPWARLLILIARRHAIRTLMVINGYLCDDNTAEGRRADSVLVYSQSIKAWQFKDSDRAMVVGNPKFEAYLGLPKKQYRKDANQTVIVSSAQYTPFDFNSPVSFGESNIADILKILQTYPGFKIKIKLHPADDPAYYRFLVHDFLGYKNVEIIGDKPFIEAIQEADLYISNWSTSNLEAAIINIPVIYYKSDVLDFHPPFDGNSEMATAHNLDELKQLIDLFLAGDKKLWRFNEVDVLEKYTGLLDGRSSERIKEKIDALLAGGS
ncbi:MAG: hypothetical protein Q8L35_05565 [Actinomycetota bacterium]|nr:hypothetical protein [Actinomycetota bacterium]